MADEIAPEVGSIVEFLNRQMRETEVLAIEVKQYVDADGTRQTIVPRLVGRTEAPRAAKRPARRGATAPFDFSTTDRGAEFNLGIFRELGVDHLADDLLQRLSSVTGRPVNGSSWPAVPCEALTHDWNRARPELIEPYFQARNQLPK